MLRRFPLRCAGGAGTAGFDSAAFRDKNASSRRHGLRAPGTARIRAAPPAVFCRGNAYLCGPNKQAYEKHPQLLHHSAHRPRQIDAGRPPFGEDQYAESARNAVAGARRHGPGAREGHHDQEPRHTDGIQGPRRADLRPEPDRHAGTRRFFVRGVARHRLVRGCAAGGRCHAGHSGPDHIESLSGARPRPGDHSRAEQDRRGFGHDRRGEGPGDRPDRLPRGGDSARLGQDGPGRRGGARSHRGACAGAAGRRGRPVAGADLRLGVQPLPRHHRLLPRVQRHAAQGATT